MDMDLARDFVIVDREVKQKEREAKAARAERELLAATLLEEMINEGLSKFTVDGKTVYLHSQKWANAKVGASGQRDFDAACKALITNGYGHLVETKFSTQRVSSLVRELDDTTDGIPQELQDTLDITEKIAPRVRGNK